MSLLKIADNHVRLLLLHKLSSFPLIIPLIMLPHRKCLDRLIEGEASCNSENSSTHTSDGTRLRLIRFPPQPSWSGTRKSSLIIFSVNFHSPFTRSRVSS